MKTIINKQTSVSYYKGENLLLTPSGASNGEWFDKDCTTANCELVTCQDVPADWCGGHYTYVSGVWARTALGEAALAAKLEKDQRARVPAIVTMRQARLALLAAGLLAGVNAAIESLPSPQKEAARIEWEYSQTVERYRPFVLTIGAALNLTSAQLDDLFVQAATL